MRNFLIYSKKPLNSQISMEETFKIKYLKRGLRLAYIFDVTGIFYAFYKKFYLLGLLLLALTMLFSFLVEIESLAPFKNYINLTKIGINIFLVIFGLEIEEFLLKYKGFAMQGFMFAKKENLAKNELESSLNITFYQTSFFKKYYNKFFKKL
jgi:hypothetical protein